MKMNRVIDIDLKELPAILEENCEDEELYQLIKSIIIQHNSYQHIARLIKDFE